ncbi:MAG: hypothetical protein ACKVU4_09460 [Phycisphaerales bacterium]
MNAASGRSATITLAATLIAAIVIGIAITVAAGRLESAAVRRAFAHYQQASRSEDPALRVQLTGPRTRAWIRQMVDGALRDDRAALVARAMFDAVTILELRAEFDRSELEALTDEHALTHFLRHAGGLDGVVISGIDPGDDEARARLSAPSDRNLRSIVFLGEDGFFTRFEDRWAFEPYVFQSGILNRVSTGLPEAERLRVLEQTAGAIPGFDPALWDGPAR